MDGAIGSCKWFGILFVYLSVKEARRYLAEICVSGRNGIVERASLARRALRPLRFNAFHHFELTVFYGHDHNRLTRVALFVHRDVPGYTLEVFGGSKRVPNFGRFRRSSSPDGIGQQTGAVVPQGSQGIRTGSVLSFISLNKSSD